MTNVESIKCANSCLKTILVLTERTPDDAQLRRIKLTQRQKKFLYEKKLKITQIGSKQIGLKTVKKPTLVSSKFGNTIKL